MIDMAAILRELLSEAQSDLNGRSITQKAIATRIEYIANCLANRAGVRLVLSCMLAKISRPALDPRQPVTEIGGDKCFSGRSFDEQFLAPFLAANRLPCNSTTAFLTPAFRNFTKPFTLANLPKGRPPRMYEDAFKLLDDVAKRKASPAAVFVDTVRHLIRLRDEQDERF
jgi:hypothetical protein